MITVSDCQLVVTSRIWGYGATNKQEIESYWQKQKKQNALLFNGTVHVAEALELRDNVFNASLARTDFKTFLHWRSKGFPAPERPSTGPLPDDLGFRQPETKPRDCFGSALIRSACGAVLLGRQREGHINGGLAYLPGGFIDDRDVSSDGRVNISRSIAREVAEETGLEVDANKRKSGYMITFCAHQVSIAVEYRWDLPAEDLRALMLAAIAQQKDPELDDIKIVRHAAQMTQISVPPYVRLLLAHVLDGASV